MLKSPNKYTCRLGKAFIEGRFCVFAGNPKNRGHRGSDNYEEFIADIRLNLKTMPLSEAIKFSIRSFLGRGIFVDFLTKHGSEVENMLLTDWNLKDALEVEREEAETRVLDLVKKGYNYEQIEKILKNKKSQ